MSDMGQISVTDAKNKLTVATANREVVSGRQERIRERIRYRTSVCGMLRYVLKLVEDDLDKLTREDTELSKSIVELTDKEDNCKQILMLAEIVAQGDTDGSKQDS